MSSSPYAARVKTGSARHPSLTNLSEFLSRRNDSSVDCRIAALDFYEGFALPYVRPSIALNDLVHELSENSSGYQGDNPHSRRSLQGRILIVEDLREDVVETLGSGLDIDPRLFASYLHTTRQKGGRSQPPDEVSLPSQLFSRDFITISYHQALITDKPVNPKNKVFRDTAIDRKLVPLPGTNLGLAQHCTSVMLRKLETGFWIALILVDPSSLNTSFVIAGEEERTSFRAQQERTPLHAQRFLGPYEDFEELHSFSTAPDDNRMTQGNCMFDDLKDYWKHNTPSFFDPKSPTLESIAYYQLKIVAAEWNQYVEVMQQCMKRYEYEGDEPLALEKLERNIKSVQNWRRRIMSSKRKTQNIAHQLQSRVAYHSDSSLKFIILDYEDLSNRIGEVGGRLEQLLPVITSLLQLHDIRRSFKETENITRLTILALIFTPPTLIASMFSMDEDVMPGSSGFWKFFAVAIPLMMFVFFVANTSVATIWRIIPWLRTKIVERLPLLLPRNEPGFERFPTP